MRQLDPGPHHLFHQFAREKARRFGNTEIDARPGLFVNLAQQLRILLLRKVRVEVTAKQLKHRLLRLDQKLPFAHDLLFALRPA